MQWVSSDQFDDKDRIVLPTKDLVKASKAYPYWAIRTLLNTLRNINVNDRLEEVEIGIMFKFAQTTDLSSEIHTSCQSCWNTIQVD